MKNELLAKLEAMELEKPGIPLPFSTRLARENGWNPEFARKVIREYKRFIYLAVKAGHPVTPSKAVD